MLFSLAQNEKKGLIPMPILSSKSDSFLFFITPEGKIFYGTIGGGAHSDVPLFFKGILGTVVERVAG